MDRLTGKRVLITGGTSGIGLETARQRRFCRWVMSADLLAAAMLQLATAGSNKKALNTGDLNRLATQMGN
jgi:NAD(P)-dependent dehydrogenase (short-subunit alcohol dehydrogenase family)